MARISRPMTSDFTKKHAAGLPANHGMELSKQFETPDKYNSNAHLFTVTERQS